MADEARGTAPEVTELRRSSRDHAALGARLAAWLRGRLPGDAAPEIVAVEGTSANGMSSETLLVDAAWTADGRREVHRLACRLAPAPEDIPVFDHYDLGRQYDTIRLVDELTDVPVPPALWCEPDPGAIGSPFFVMGRVDGRVPPDVMPYNFGDSWLYDAATDEQRHLQDATVDVLARLHAIDRPAEHFAFLAPGTAAPTAAGPASALRQRVAATRAWYEFAAGDGFRSPLVERHLRLARRPLARPRGRPGAVLGRLAHRQRDVRRVRPGGGARLGDGHPRATRARRRLAGLRPPHLRGHRRLVRARGDARLPAGRRRGSHLRVAHGPRARATSPGSARTPRCSTPSSSCAPAPGPCTSARPRCPGRSTTSS